MYKYAIIGFGGLGRMHLTNLLKLEKIRGDFKLAAICGTTAEEAKKNVTINLGTADMSNVDFSQCNVYQDYKEMIDKVELDFVFSVLPSYLHEEVALYTLSHGIDLFSEKPMALTLESCEKIMKAAEDNGRKLMIGQCMRFHPVYLKIKEFIDNNIYGKVRRAEFNRYSQMPLWTWNNWILDCEKSGGSPVDFHVHDVDLINFFFGVPDSLRSAMTNMKLERESISTQYFYDGFMISSQADWALPQTYPFREECQVDFENATVRIENEKLTVYTDTEVLSPAVGGEDSLFEEEKAFLNYVIDGIPCEKSTSESVYESMKIVMKEIESAQSGKTVFFK